MIKMTYQIRRFVIYLIFLDSSVVEHSAVNRRVVGSNPTRGAKSFKRGSFLMIGMRAYSSAG